MTTNKQILFITALIAAFVFIGTIKFIYQPRTQQLSRLLKTLDEEYEKNRIFFEIGKIKDEIDTRSAKEMLKSEKDLPWLLGRISEIFNSLHLELISIEPQPLEKAGFYTRIPVKVKTVCSYHSLGELLSRLEKLDRFVEVSYLELKSFREAESAKEEIDASGLRQKAKPLKRRLDNKGFVLTEATLKVSAIYLH